MITERNSSVKQHRFSEKALFFTLILMVKLLLQMKRKHLKKEKNKKEKKDQ